MTIQPSGARRPTRPALSTSERSAGPERLPPGAVAYLARRRLRRQRAGSLPRVLRCPVTAA
jgi:hypothetical protein